MKEDADNSILYVQIIIESIDAIFRYLYGRTKEEFSSDAQLQDACLMRLVVIGEYAAKIPVTVQKNYPEIEWRSMKGARNFYVHGYAEVDKEKIWDTIHIHLLPLKEKLMQLIKKENL